MGKDTNRKYLFGSKKLSELLRNYFLAQNSLIRGIVYHKKLDNRTKEISALLLSCICTAKAISELGQQDLYNECIMLARAYLEKLVNFSYLLICEKKEFDNYLLHTVQKSFRRLDRSIEAGGLKLGLKFRGDVNLGENSLLKKALNEFTSDKGTEKTHWTKKAIIDRVEEIKSKSNINISIFLFNILSYYEIASEALHGTLYGCTFHTGAYDPAIDHTNEKEQEINLQKNITLLYWSLGEMLNEVVKLVFEKNKIVEVIEGAKNNSENALKIMKSALGNETGKNGE